MQTKYKNQNILDAIYTAPLEYLKEYFKVNFEGLTNTKVPDEIVSPFYREREKADVESNLLEELN